jgi:Coenzyme PQQ synthesis protein D (PqqD)
MQMSLEGAAPEHTVRQSPDVVSSRLGEGGVLVNLRTNRILELNATGIRIWELIGEGRAMGAIARQLQQEFDVAEEELRQELVRLVDDLSREGLIDVSPGG